MSISVEDSDIETIRFIRFLEDQTLLKDQSHFIKK